MLRVHPLLGVAEGGEEVPFQVQGPDLGNARSGVDGKLSSLVVVRPLHEEEDILRGGEGLSGVPGP